MIRTIDFAGTIVLNDQSKNLNQPVYSSQSYGTYYSVFAQITTKPHTDNGKIILEKIKFKILNYTGLLDLSLKSAIPAFTLSNNGTKVLSIELRMMGATTRSADLSVSIDFTAVNKDTEGNEVPLYPEFYDESVRTIKTGDMIEVTRNLLSLNGVNKDSIAMYNPGNSDHVSGGVFDSEFYTRAGEGIGAIKRKKLTPLDSLSIVRKLNGETLPVPGGQDGGNGQLCYSGAAYFQID